MESLGGAGTLPDAQITQMQKKFDQAQGQIDKAYAQIKEKEKCGSSSV